MKKILIVFIILTVIFLIYLCINNIYNKNTCIKNTENFADTTSIQPMELSINADNSWNMNKLITNTINGGAGNMGITSDKVVALYAKDGTVCSKYNGGNGNLNVDGALIVAGTANVNGELQINSTIRSNIKGKDGTSDGRMHIAGDEGLYLLNKNGVIISKAWEGNGNLSVEGNANVGALTVAGAANVNGELQISSVIRTINKGEAGRMHISGDEGLYLLNKNGVLISKAWGGNGNLHVDGNASIVGNANVNGELQIGSVIRTLNKGEAGRMHITGDESLYLLNKNGVLISKAWGGNGNLVVDGTATVGGELKTNTINGGATGLGLTSDKSVALYAKGGTVCSKYNGGNGNLTVDGDLTLESSAWIGGAIRVGSVEKADDVSILSMNDIVLGGRNKWSIHHHPDEKVLLITPWVGDNPSWDKALKIDNNGDVTIQGKLTLRGDFIHYPTTGHLGVLKSNNSDATIQGQLNVGTFNDLTDRIKNLEDKCNNITGGPNGITKIQFGEGYAITQENHDSKNKQIIFKRNDSVGRIVFTLGIKEAYEKEAYIELKRNEFKVLNTLSTEGKS